MILVEVKGLPIGALTIIVLPTIDIQVMSDYDLLDEYYYPLSDEDFDNRYAWINSDYGPEWMLCTCIPTAYNTECTYYSI